MKILFLSHYPSLYGANRSLLNLINELQKNGDEPHVITQYKGELTDELDRIKVAYTFHKLDWGFINKEEYSGITNYFKRIKSVRRDYLNANRIAKAIKHYNFDIIYTNSSVLNTGFFIAQVLGLPHVWHLREFGELHYNITPILGYNLFKLLLKRSEAVIFVSNCLRRYYHLENNKKSHVIYNGVVSKDFFLKHRERAEVCSKEHRDFFVFCIVGVIGFQKNQIEAIKAFKILREKYSDIKLIVVGGGDRDYLERYIVDNKISGIEFTGHVAEPFPIFISSDASLMCSRHEAMGRVTVESMSVGTPVIGFNSSGTQELIKHDETGLLYDGSVEDLAKQMERLLLDAGLRGKLAKKAWEWAFHVCTQEIYGEKVYNVISAIDKNISVNK